MLTAPGIIRKMLLMCGLLLIFWPHLSHARSQIAYAVSDTLRSDTLPPTPARNGFTTDPATRPLTREDWFRINQTHPQTLDRQITQRRSRAKTEKVVINIVLVLLGLSAFLTTVLGIWWLAATGGSSYPNLGIAILASLRVLGAILLVAGLAELGLFISLLQRLARDKRSQK